MFTGENWQSAEFIIKEKWQDLESGGGNLQKQDGNVPEPVKVHLRARMGNRTHIALAYAD